MDTAAGNIVAASIFASHKFIDRLIGPSADAAGVWIRDEIKGYFGKNMEAVATQAQQMLSDARIRPRDVSARQLITILRGTSVEEEPSLQTLWAALLANAAALRTEGEPVATFASILGKLRPIDANVLDIIARSGTRPTEQGGMLRGALLAADTRYDC